MVLEESQLYRDLMRLRPDGWTANAWAVRAGVSRTVWTDMRRHGNPSRRTLEKLLAAAGSSLAEFEALRIAETPPPGPAQTDSAVSDRTGLPWREGSLPTLPLVAASAGDQWDTDGTAIALTELRTGAILDRLPRPLSLADDPGAFAFVVATDAMWPRFRPGRTVAVSPKAPAEPGDDVLVILSSSPDGRSAVFIAELVSRSTTHVELRQFNPAVSFRLVADCCQAIYEVVGELI